MSILFIMFVSIPAFASYTQTLNNVKFYAMDDTDGDNNDDTVILEIDNYLTSSSKFLQYSCDGSNWNNAGSSITLSVTDGKKELVYMRIYDGSNADNDGTLKFLGTNGPNLWNMVRIEWGTGDSIGLSLAVPEGSDSVSPASAPVPGAAWILGAGILGLVGFRRKT
jgi:hypothetical protein